MGSMPELPPDTTAPTSPETSPTSPETSPTSPETSSTQQTTQSTPSVEPPVDDSEVTSFINILFLFITYILI